jgi:hypothetical protein
VNSSIINKQLLLLIKILIINLTDSGIEKLERIRVAKRREQYLIIY